MVYIIAKFLVRIAAELFFSKHHLRNLDALETNKPLIVCANHASAHLDGILIMIFSKRKYHVLVRADIFQKKWLANILAKFHLIPIYRMRDGISNMDKNDETFKKCFDILKNNGAIIIFPEANCVMERGLRKLHKGASKIGFMAEEKFDFKLGLQFATIGICQERLSKPGGRLFLTASKPFNLSDYKETYQQNNQKAYTDVTDRIDKDLRSVLPIIEDRNDEKLFESLILYSNIRDQYDAWDKLSKTINQSDPELKSALQYTIQDFDQHLSKKGLDILSLQKLLYKVRIKRWANLALYVIDLMALFPFFVIGIAFNFLPYYIPSRLTKWIFKNEKEYINGTHMVGSLFLFLLAYMFYIVLFLFLNNNPIALMVILLVIASCGVVSYYYRKRFFEFVKALRFEFAGTKQHVLWKQEFEVLKQEFNQWNN